MSSTDAEIYVLAGVNGAGKSSVAGAMLQQSGLAFFNPDVVARRFQEVEGSSPTAANAAAWNFGKELLEQAIAQGVPYAFETTLGGNTIPSILKGAAERGIPVNVWYVGLVSIALHLERVRARVASGGHDIPEAKIRERWKASPANLIALMPDLSEVRVFDNSRNRTASGEFPEPRLLLHTKRGVNPRAC